nr:arginine kinase [Desulfobacula sp.]
MLTATWFSGTSSSLVKKHLSQALFKSLEHLETASGFTLEKAIRSGIQNPDSSIGIYAGDADSYQVFSPVFDPVISEYHNFPKGGTHVSDFALPDLPPADPGGKYILSTRIRVARNLKDYSFPANLTLSCRKALEKKIIRALGLLESDLAGEYRPLEDVGKGHRPEDKGLAFEKGDRFQDAAGINSDFPKGRGVFHSLDRKLMVWVNEEDHLRIMSLERSSHLSLVFHRLCRALQALSPRLGFAFDHRLGYLTSCPTNLGTAMRAGVHIRLEKLDRKKELLHGLAKEYHLQIRGTRGEKTEVEDAVFDISNAQRLGIGEAAVIQTLHQGLLAIIKAEETL